MSSLHKTNFEDCKKNYYQQSKIVLDFLVIILLRGKHRIITERFAHVVSLSHYVDVANPNRVYIKFEIVSRSILRNKFTKHPYKFEISNYHDRIISKNTYRWHHQKNIQ